MIYKLKETGIFDVIKGIIGHSQLHCIIPFGVNATGDIDKQEIIFQ